MKQWWRSASEFAKQVRLEAQRVTWPARAEVISITWVVFILLAVFAVFFLIVDSLCSKMIWWFLA